MGKIHSSPTGSRSLPPVVTGLADNGLSVDPITGNYVLGNDAGGNLAALLTPREIDMNIHNMNWKEGYSFFFDTALTDFFLIDPAFNSPFAQNFQLLVGSSTSAGISIIGDSIACVEFMNGFAAVNRMIACANGDTNFQMQYACLGGFPALNWLNSGVITVTDSAAHVDSGAKFQVKGNMSIGEVAVASAKLHIDAGTNNVGDAPFKYSAGVLAQTAVENGAKNFDGSNESLAVGGVTYIMAKTLTATGVLDFPNTVAGTSSDLTIALTGAALGDVVVLGVPNGSTAANGCFTAWVSAANTITVRFTNTNLVVAIDPASGTFRVSILKY